MPVAKDGPDDARIDEPGDAQHGAAAEGEARGRGSVRPCDRGVGDEIEREIRGRGGGEEERSGEREGRPGEEHDEGVGGERRGVWRWRGEAGRLQP